MLEASDLVGRTDERAVLDRFLAGAGRRALVVTGAAGVGKTALIEWFADGAAAAGWHVVHAVGVEAETSFALGGLNQMVFGLRTLVARLDATDRTTLAAVLGGDPDAPPSPMALAGALVNLLSEAARTQPVLLIVEDVHWFDELSAASLSAAGRRLAEPGVRMITTLRPHTGTPFATAGWSDLELEPLDAADSARLIDGLAVALTAAARRAILAAAAGNPLALVELPRSAGEIDAAWSALPLTERLVTVFSGRLHHLDARVRGELLRAALDGANTSTLTDSGARYVMRDVSEAVSADLLTVDAHGDIAFRHPLVRAAVIHQADPDERRAAHARLADLYDPADPDGLIRRAVHLSAATDGPDQSVADLLDAAARQSIRRGGATVAVDWLRRAADLSTDPARRANLYADAGFVASQSGRFDAAQLLADNVRAAGGEPPSAVLTGAYLALYRDGEVTTSHRRVLAALDDAESLDDATVSRLVNLALALAQYGAEPDVWRQTTEAMARLADRLPPVSPIFRDSWGDVARTGHTVRARLAEHVAQLSSLEPWEVMRLGVAAYYVDGLDDFRTTLGRLLDRERERGAVTNAMTMQHLVLLDLIRCGQWADAAAAGRDGLELTRIHHNELFGHQFSAHLSVLAASVGDLDAAHRDAAAVMAWAAPRRLGLLTGYAQRAVVLAALTDGDHAAAYQAALRICTPGEFPPYRYQAVDGLLDVVEAALHSGHVEAARTHAKAAVRADLPAISPRLAALTAAVVAMTAADDAAGPLYDAALAHPALGAIPFEEARVALAYGMWLRRKRLHTQSRDVLARAERIFESLGTQPWATRARTELRAAGATVKRAAGTGAQLSAQERRIAELAAAGHSNKQIAAEMYLSPRTVGAHLYRIFPKLGITSRAGLALALRDLGGVPLPSDP